MGEHGEMGQLVVGLTPTLTASARRLPFVQQRFARSDTERTTEAM